MAMSVPIGKIANLSISSQNLLAPDECLVYIENRQPFADVSGTTQIAKVIRSYIIDDKSWFDLLLITDSDGDQIKSVNQITVSGDNIVSKRSFHDILPRELYHFATLTLSENIEYPITARGFVIKKNLDGPLESTSRSALGSGIYGRYVKNRSQIDSLTNDNQSVYLIDCSNAYILQDRAHGESITVASLNTNRYMDRIIQSLISNRELTLDQAKIQLRMNSNPNILTLWNIALYRTEDFISYDALYDILASYIMKYLFNASLFDTINGEILQELPINSILNSLGYDGILASDSFNNGWDRGCISYNYSQAAILQGETARY